MRKTNSELPRLSPKEALIMRMALERPAEKVYGLELVKASGGQLKRGTIYVTLMRMTEKGYVDSAEEEGTGGERRRPRRFYWVTGYGKRVYAAEKRRAQNLFGLDTPGLAGGGALA